MPFEAAIQSHESVADRSDDLDLANLVKPERYVEEIVDWIEQRTRELS